MAFNWISDPFGRYPSFVLTGINAGVVDDRLLRIEIVDEEGLKSDGVKIELDNRFPHIQRPQTGQQITAGIGYGSGSEVLGEYLVDHVEMKLKPDEIHIRGKAADMKGPLKEQKDRHWDEKTLGDIVGGIAGEHGLTPRISPALASVKLPYLGQSEESDIHLLTRIAARNDALFSIKQGNLVFVKRGEGTTASGQAIPAIIVRPEMIIEQGSVTFQDRPVHKEVSAKYHDSATGETVEELMSTNQPGATARYKIRQPFANKEEASAAADSKARQLNRGKGSASLTIFGDPSIIAGAPLQFSGFGYDEDIADEWIVKRVTHTLDNSGFRSQVECEVKGDSSGSGSGGSE
jgi:phage protein D